jgi:hypothetical protein
MHQKGIPRSITTLTIDSHRRHAVAECPRQENPRYLLLICLDARAMLHGIHYSPPSFRCVWFSASVHVPRLNMCGVNSVEMRRHVAFRVKSVVLHIWPPAEPRNIRKSISSPRTRRTGSRCLRPWFSVIACCVCSLFLFVVIRKIQPPPSRPTLSIW